MDLKSLDYIFISYDEENAESNWEHLLQIVPHAKRVHGIKGYDAAHKAAAQLATTENFIVVDGDCRLNPEFINQQLKFNDGVNLKRDVISWPSYNPVNNLAYGNGGVKCWPRQVMLNLKSHEVGDGVDFDYESYIQLDEPYGGTTVINTTPLQAWRVGFREGIKLKLLDKKYYASDHPDGDNRTRLWVWQNIGADIENGLYAIAGARHSVALANEGWDYKQINDLEILNDIFKSTDVLKYIDNTVYDEGRSIEFKQSFKNPKRLKHKVLSDIDNKFEIVFISYDEPYADDNYKKLLERFPDAKRIHGIKGIHNAHMEAAKIVNTSHFWVVDADAEIVDTFNFDFFTSADDECVRVWRAKNIANNLTYGNGGVKLLPKNAVLNMTTVSIDMTTNITWNYKSIYVLSNINNFSQDPFTAWRGAFRECAKLAAKYKETNDSKINDMLNTWCTVAEGPYAEYILKGANSGKKLGEAFYNKKNVMMLINSFRFLHTTFVSENS